MELISIVLIVIGSLCAAAGASALAARVSGVLSKLRKAIRVAGKVGEVLTTLFRKLDELAELIGKLSKELRRRIDEVVTGVTDRMNPVTRKAFVGRWPNKRASEILKELEELSKKEPTKDNVARKRILSEQLGNEGAKHHLRNQLGRDIPDEEFRTFNGPHTVNLYYKDPSTGKVYIMEAKGGNSTSGWRLGRHKPHKGVRLEQGTQGYLEDVATQMTKNRAGSARKIETGKEILNAIKKDNFEYITVRSPYDVVSPAGRPLPPTVLKVVRPPGM